MIKKIICSLLATFLLPVGMMAQESKGNVVVYRTDGQQITIPATEVERITFELTADENQLTAVDLGLSVKWANLNLDLANASKVADAPEAYGGFYGWADTTGELTISDVDYYPSTEVPDNISGTEYDICRAQLGVDWRLPTKEEAQELCDKCTFIETTINGIHGHKVVGANGNWIFLPWAGYRYGEKRFHDNQYGYYWTGTLNEKVSKFAYYLNVYSGRYAMANNIRYNGCSVRAVTEK